MYTNLSQHNKFIENCRQLLPDVRVTQLRNLGFLIIGLLNSVVMNTTQFGPSCQALVAGLAYGDCHLESQRERAALRDYQHQRPIGKKHLSTWLSLHQTTTETCQTYSRLFSH